MYLDDTVSQAQRVEASRRPQSRGNMLFSSNEDDELEHETIQYERPGSSLKNLFSKTVSLKSSGTTTRSGRSTLLSKKLSIPEEDSVRSSSLVSSPVTTSSTIDSNFSLTARASWDPPPLFQACPQASRFALLDSPSASIESILRHNTQNHVTGPAAGSMTTTSLDDANVSSKHAKKQKRTTQASNTSGWTKKLYILVTNGYVLQYDGDGHHDRLPEKILQLGHYSVAFASDAIPGKPYVLQISSDPNLDDEPMEAGAKGLWSRIGFRNMEDKRMARTLLLVFDSADELDAWMVGVRREIEAHGGAHYRSGTPRADPDQVTPEHDLEDRFQLHQDECHVLQRPHSAPTESQESDDANSFKYEPLPEIKPLSGLWFEDVLFQTKRTSEGSSSNSITDLDHLRGSSQSYSSTATGHRLSFDEPTNSPSPAADKVSDTYAVLTGGQSPSVVTTQSVTSVEAANTNDAPAGTSVPSELVITTPLSEQRELCGQNSNSMPIVPNFSLLNLSQSYSRYSLAVSDRSSVATSEILNITSIEQIGSEELASEKPRSERPTSTIAPLPSREAMSKKSRSRVWLIENSRPLTSPLGHQSGIEMKAVREPAYTVLPKRYSSSDTVYSSLPSTTSGVGLSNLPAGASHQRSSSTPSDAAAGVVEVQKPKRMDRTVSMHIDLRSSFETEKAERSPAVTDLHFATNFGTANPFGRSSSIGLPSKPIPSSVPQIELVNTSIRASSKPTRGKASSSSARGPPAGPPPTRPLPAPPSSYARGSSVRPSLSVSRRVVLDLTTDEY